MSPTPWHKLSAEQKKDRIRKNNERKKARLKIDPEFRKKQSLKAKKYNSRPETKLKNKLRGIKWRKSLSQEERKRVLGYSREYNKKYKDQQAQRFLKTGDLNIYFQQKNMKVKRSAKERNIPFEITVSELVEKYQSQKGRCYYTDEKLLLTLRTGKFNREDYDKLKNSLTYDRLDSKKGYTKENVVLATFKCNIAKSWMDYEDFVKVCENIKIKSY